MTPTAPRADLARERWASLRPEMVARLHALWSKPELPMMEFEAEAALSAWLTEHGFRVARGAGGLPTAFVARYERGAGPVVGVLAEYDALPGQGNRAVPREEPDGHAAGHACGHNQIGAANTGAAIAARHAMEALGLEGSVVVVGCPAEEIVWGKVALLDAGAFAGIDALLTSHGDYQTGALSRPCLSVLSSELVFRGRSSHAGAPQSHNALDAVELTVQSIERLRPGRFHDVKIDHVLRVGGLMPSITPSEARLWITCRHVDYERAAAAYQFVLEVAARAAELASTRVDEQFIAATRGYLPNDVLAATLHRSMGIVGAPAWSGEDLEWMRALGEACTGAETLELERGVGLYRSGVDPYSQDDGEVSWRVPLARANWAMPEGVPLHMWGTTALAGHRAGEPGPLMVSESLALAAVALLAEPALVAEARRELEERIAGRALSPPRYGGFEVLTRHPERFWNATWRI